MERFKYRTSRSNSRLVGSVFRPVALGGALVIGVLMTTGLASVEAGVKGGAPAATAALRDADLDALLTKEARRLVARLPRIEGQRKKGPVAVEAWMDLATGRITVNFDTGYLPSTQGGAWEDLMNEFSVSLGLVAARVMQSTSLQVLFDGKELDHYVPFIPAPASLRGIWRSTGFAAVSAGHGAYYHHGYLDWRYQRDQHNGITEDEITPLLAAELKARIEDRSRQPVHRMRSDATLEHEGSQKPWWALGARYAIEAQYPSLTEIWNSLSGATANLRERDEDIRSRPLLANHLGADVLISLHTNGSDRPEARGARVFYQNGRERDQQLAQRVLCYMKEIVTAQEGYADFPISSVPEPGNHGENRLAEMPAIIVETAFHTNAADALALQDEAFRQAAMKGVEKGWRMFSEDKGCTPLKTLSVPDVSMSQQSERLAKVNFEGYPQYPLRVETRNVACPPRWTCNDGLRTIAAPSEEPLQLVMACKGNGSAPILWATRLVDADGVATAEVAHRQQCIRRPGPGVPVPEAEVNSALQEDAVEGVASAVLHDAA